MGFPEGAELVGCDCPGRLVVQHDLDHFHLQETNLGGRSDLRVVVYRSAVPVEACSGVVHAAVDFGSDITEVPEFFRRDDG